MKLVLPPGLLQEERPELRVYVAPVAPLPYNLQAWGDEIVSGGLPLAQINVLWVDDVQTATGWPLTLIESEVTTGPQPVVRRLHALYRFLEFGAVVVVYSSPAFVDSHRTELLALLTAGEPDLTAIQATSLADFFADADAPSPGNGAPAA